MQVYQELEAGEQHSLDYDPLTPLGSGNVNGHILFGMNGSKVVTTVANGKVLMKDRELQHIDEAKVMADCREASEALWNRING